MSASKEDEILYCHSGFFRFWFVDGKIRVNFTKPHEDDENNHKNTLLENQEKSVVL
jgi:hypothetical protein